MNLDIPAWLRDLDLRAPGQDRDAVAPDPARRNQAAACMLALDLEPGADLYPWGLDPRRALWKPWADARDAAELYAQPPQEPGAQADWILYDRRAGTVTLATLADLPSRCPRFSARACPRMAPMGHESAQADCNYWQWPAFAGVTPHLELYPEWQRFDCHKYYPLFQLHIAGEALARALGARPLWQVHGPGGRAGLVDMYGSFTDKPAAFTFHPL